ncbi:MAG TPA: hypothetical protein P5515_08905 [Methanolinea sp.]|nr:hypothetical protein [Methanolinea sp.]
MILEGSERQNNKNSAVSETVGYIIIFGIMMTGIALIILLGYPALLNQQQEANIRNMERNMIVLQSDVNALAYKSVPYKETTMQVSGGVLSVENPVAVPDVEKSFRITISPELPETSFSPGGLKFLSENGDISILLQSGAIVKYQSGGSVMVSEPRWFIDSVAGRKTMVISLIQVYSPKNLGKSGIGTVQMSVEPLNMFDGDTTNFKDFSASPPYTVVVKPPLEYKTAWENYLRDSLEMTNNPSGSISWEKTDLDRVVIKAWRINVINL